MGTTHLQDQVNAAESGTFQLGGDLPVYRLGYGAMRVLERVVELGINFIDTADAYGPEVNERQIAEVLHPYKQGLVIATKGGNIRTGPGKWAPVGRPEYLHQQVELSLRRLKVERIDLWQLHRIDPKVPL